ncbi:MAG: hypothetical protein MUF54_21005 [Polyangiaceae bacterium]|jgi:hypothetical protein|nr:hypothetical protein [Polyangiaceae bacterium]
MGRTPARNQVHADASPQLGETARAVISVVLFAHLFIVATCLASNLVPSLLQQRLLRLFRPYARVLNFDLDGTRYYLTHGSQRDVDHRIEVLPSARDAGDPSSWVGLVRGSRGSERYHRYQRLAEAVTFFQDDDAVTALLAEGIVRQSTRHDGQALAEVRCRQHLLQSWAAARSEVPAERDPESATYYATVYAARVISGDRGEIRILKRESAALEAQPGGPR